MRDPAIEKRLAEVESIMESLCRDTNGAYILVLSVPDDTGSHDYLRDGVCLTDRSQSRSVLLRLLASGIEMVLDDSTVKETKLVPFNRA